MSRETLLTSTIRYVTFRLPRVFCFWIRSRATGNSCLESEKFPPPVQRKIPENSRSLKRLIVHRYKRYLSLKNVLFYSQHNALC